MKMVLMTATAEIPERMAKHLKIELDYLGALAANEKTPAVELHSRLAFVLGQLDAMRALECIEYNFYVAAVEEVYSTYHGRGTYRFE